MESKIIDNNFNRIKSALWFSLKIGATIICLGLLFMGAIIVQNSIDISQLFSIIAEQFPEQELYSIADYIRHSSPINRYSYIALSVVYVGLVVFFGYQFHKAFKTYSSEMKTLQEEIEKLVAAHPFDLPSMLDNERAQKYLKRAVDKKILYCVEDGMRLNETYTKSQLGYLLRKIYCPNLTEQLPETELDTYFGTHRIGESIRKLTTNNNQKPKNAATIDALFYDDEIKS